jgi:23S rRNA (adenine1618-N6)-methyltransferase
MHHRNKHQEAYDFKALVQSSPELLPFVIKNKKGEDSVEFSNPLAVKALNRAILRHYYKVSFWDIPPGFLCPPIPGRADYIHTVADLIEGEARVLDIGVGANCVYPLIGHVEYNWKFVGTDIDPRALAAAKKIVTANNLSEDIELRLQPVRQRIFNGVINGDETFSLVICNPPFHESLAAATEGSSRKWRNLGKKNLGLNFGGQEAELWCPGGEKAFIKKMIDESVHFKAEVKWFTTLVSREANLPFLLQVLKGHQVPKVEILDLSHGQKKSRILVWQFSR